MKIPELLAPVGSRESLYAAVSNGCDAVYLGGKNFNARSSADNFEPAVLDEAIDYCHIRGVKVYITVNTLYRNDELNSVLDFCEKAYRAGADAFIMQDIGTAFFIKQNLPGIKLFASTQTTVGDPAGAEFLSQYFDRVILSREASFETIRRVVALNKTEVEVFAHGALCFCHSGQCLMSGVIGGRSGNRGKCAQPCRMKYDLLCRSEIKDSGYLLSPRDLCTLSILPELISCGVDSIKIEGRMKSPEYTALTTGTYRRQLDKIASGDIQVDEESFRKLSQIFNRGGSFTDGYFKKWAGHDMMSKETPKSRGIYVGSVVNNRPAAKKAVINTEVDLACGDGIEICSKTFSNTGTYINKASTAGELAAIDIEGRLQKGDMVYKSFDKKLSDELKKYCVPDTEIRKITVSAFVYAKTGQKIKLILKYKDITVQSEGAVCSSAVKRPMTSGEIERQLGKTGGTTLLFDFIETVTEDNLFIGIKDLNELRRTASQLLINEIIKSGKRELSIANLSIKLPPKSPHLKQELTVHVSSLEQLKSVTDEKPHRIIFEAYISLQKGAAEAIQTARTSGIRLYAAMPKTICGDAGSYKKLAEALPEIDGYMLRYYGQLAFCKDKGSAELIADHSFNTFNSLQQKFLLDAGFTGITLSPELNLEQIKEITAQCSDVIIHGRLPLMTTNQCVIGNIDDNRTDGNGRFCKRRNPEGYALKDSLGLEFPILTDCTSCVAQILNSKPIFTLNKLEDISKLNAGSFRLLFTTESGEDAAALTSAYKAKLNHLKNINNAQQGLALHAANKLIHDILDNSKIYEGVTNGHFYRGVL